MYSLIGKYTIVVSILTSSNTVAKRRELKQRCLKKKYRKIGLLLVETGKKQKLISVTGTESAVPELHLRWVGICAPNENRHHESSVRKIPRPLDFLRVQKTFSISSHVGIQRICESTPRTLKKITALRVIYNMYCRLYWYRGPAILVQKCNGRYYCRAELFGRKCDLSMQISPLDG